MPDETPEDGAAAPQTEPDGGAPLSEAAGRLVDELDEVLGGLNGVDEKPRPLVQMLVAMVDRHIQDQRDKQMTINVRDYDLRTRLLALREDELKQRRDELDDRKKQRRDELDDRKAQRKEEQTMLAKHLARRGWLSFVVVAAIVAMAFGGLIERSEILGLMGVVVASLFVQPRSKRE